MDLIRSGKTPEVIRRKGAEGSLPLPAEEAIEILALLAVAPEADLRAKALATLEGWDRADVRRVMASPQTAPDVLSFAAEHMLAEWDELREILLSNPSLPAESRCLLQVQPVPEPAVGPASQPERAPLSLPPLPEAAKELSPPPEFEHTAMSAAENAAVEILAKLAAGAEIDEVAGAPVESPPEVTKRDDELTTTDRETLIQKVGRMSVVQKIKAALTGNMETRAILVRDGNKVIARAVLQSPKISETEAESYAAAKNVSEEVLRLIAMNRKFMRAYPVMRALVNNPRAPIDVTLRLMPRLHDSDLKGVSINRNVPDVIRSLAIKMIKQKEDAAKVKLPGKH